MAQRAPKCLRMFGSLAASVLLASACPNSTSQPSASPPPEDQETRYRRELAEFAADAPADKIAEACHFLRLAPNSPKLSSDELARCKAATLSAIGASKVSEGSTISLEMLLEDSRACGAGEAEIHAASEKRKRKEPKWAAAEARERAAEKRQALVDGTENRQLVADRLRENFLDQGLDIKVRLKGRYKERITFTYVLFSDVWSHRFETEGILDSLQAAGYQRVDMTDDYDWHVHWTF
ncbi:MAG: hypothetical protein ABJC13_16985 [Acidobacteriota bacterium]